MFVDENLFYTNVIRVIMRSYFKETIWFQINLGNVTILEVHLYCGFASVSSVLV